MGQARLAVLGLAADGQAARHPLLCAGLRLAAVQGVAIRPGDPGSAAAEHPQHAEALAMIQVAAAAAPPRPSARPQRAARWSAVVC